MKKQQSHARASGVKIFTLPIFLSLRTSKADLSAYKSFALHLRRGFDEVAPLCVTVLGNNMMLRDEGYTNAVYIWSTW